MVGTDQKSSRTTSAIKNQFGVAVDAKGIYNVNFVCVCEMLSPVMLFLIVDQGIVN